MRILNLSGIAGKDLGSSEAAGTVRLISDGGGIEDKTDGDGGVLRGGGEDMSDCTSSI